MSIFRRTRAAQAAAGLGLALLLGACSPKLSYQEMADQPRYEALEGSDSLSQGMSAQPLVPGTIARGGLQSDILLHTGRTPEGELAGELPFPVSEELLRHGQTRYGIYCVPCHDAAGTGAGIVVRQGYPAPPSLHAGRLREAPIGHFFEVITNGLGDMPAYGAYIPAEDRWAISAYIRALQLSQNAPLEAVPEGERDSLEQGAPS